MKMERRVLGGVYLGRLGLVLRTSSTEDRKKWKFPWVKLILFPWTD